MSATVQELTDRLLATSDYATTADLVKAYNRRTLLMQLIVIRPLRVRGTSQEIEFELNSLKHLLEEVNGYIAVNAGILSGRSDTIRADLRRFRG